jgi:hypothetical protein
MNRDFIAALIGAFLVLPFGQVHAADAPREPYGIDLEGFAYPYPVSLFPVANDGEQLRMAYMDVGASGQPNGRTVVLLLRADDLSRARRA